MFLQKTKLSAKVMIEKKYHLGFSNYIALDCEGRSGGITLLWKEEVKVSVLSYSKQHIDALIIDCANNTEWHITGVYGHPDSAHRLAIWNLIITIN